MQHVVPSDDSEMTCQLLTGIALADDWEVAYFSGELARLASLLSKGDDIYTLTTASQKLMPGVLALVTDRLIFVKRRRLVGPWVQMELPYSTITFVGLETIGSEIRLQLRLTSRRRGISFRLFPTREKAQEVFRLLNQLSTHARAKSRYSHDSTREPTA